LFLLDPFGILLRLFGDQWRTHIPLQSVPGLNIDTEPQPTAATAQRDRLAKQMGQGCFQHLAMDQNLYIPFLGG
jgi:hypothetical protein